jgi:hypothetical protein
MKTNKKAILGFALAMVFSLAIMQGNSIKGNKQDVNLVGAAIAYYGSEQGGAANTISSCAAGTVVAGWGYTVATATAATGWGILAGGAMIL